MLKNPQTAGVWMMVIAVLSIPLSDAIAKLLTQSLSVGQITLFRFLFQGLILLGLLVILSKLNHWKFQLGRLTRQTFFLGSLIALSILFLFWGLNYLPLANNIALFFIEPLVLVLLSAVLLKEPVTLNRWLAVCLGLIGALVVIRPNWALYGWSSLLPILAAIFYAAFMVFTRKWSNDIQLQTALSIQFNIALAALVIMLGFSLVAIPLNWPLFALQVPSFLETIDLFFIGAISAAVHILIILALAKANASLLAPLQYLEIFGAIILGWLWFSEIPDLLTAIGMTIIVISGLWVIKQSQPKSAVSTSTIQD